MNRIKALPLINLMMATTLRRPSIGQLLAKRVVFSSKISTKRSIHGTCCCRHPFDVPSPYENATGLNFKLRKMLKMLALPKDAMAKSSIFMYEACTDGLPIEVFFKHLNLPDTYLSWFLVTELHVWMIMVRSMVEGPEGKFVRDQVVTRMWEDADARLKKLAHMPSKDRKETLIELLEHFQAAVVSYDEGLLGDDKALAGALWRILFTYECNDPEILETLVSYIRFQLDHLSSIPREVILLLGEIEWAPFPPLICTKSIMN